MKIISCAFALSIYLIPGVVTASDVIPSHCQQDEKIIFSCSTGKKIISVCASANLSKTSGYMQYRYGPVGQPELVFPLAKEHPNNHFSFTATTGISGGAYTSLMFNVGQFGYEVYSTSQRGEDPKDGVRVTKAGKQVTDIKCKTQLDDNFDRDAFEGAGIKEMAE